MAIKKEDRSVQVHFRVTQKEFEEINENKEKTGLRLSEYARRMLMGETIVEAPPADLNILIREIKRVGSNLNQLIKKLNVLGVAHPLELDRCAQDLHEVINLIYETYHPGKGDD